MEALGVERELRCTEGAGDAVTPSLFTRYEQLRADKPRLHARDAAKTLGVSEVELVAALPSARALVGPFPAIVAGLETVGDVKTLTRNEAAVLERWGRFSKLELVEHAHLGQVVGEEIDLRLFFRAWKFGYFVAERGPKGPRISLQFFDAQGDSIHKVYAEDDAAAEAITRLADAHAGDPGPVELEAPSPVETPADVDVAAFREGWDAMQDTHEFHMLLRKFRLPRLAALELAGAPRAQHASPDALERILEASAAAAEPIMIFVGSRGALQIHTGVIGRVQRMGGYLNVLDPRVNLHVRDDMVRHAFIVRKPTADGIVTSVELYDETGETLAMVFSKRKPGQLEKEWWRELAASLERPAA